MGDLKKALDEGKSIIIEGVHVGKRLVETVRQVISDRKHRQIVDGERLSASSVPYRAVMVAFTLTARHDDALRQAILAEHYSTSQA